MQVAPLRHGFGEHSFTLTAHVGPEKPKSTSIHMLYKDITIMSNNNNNNNNNNRPNSSSSSNSDDLSAVRNITESRQQHLKTFKNALGVDASYLSSNRR